MKILYSSIFLLFMTVSFTLAQEWSENFSFVYLDKGIDEAVIMALSEGANPYQIINTALPLEGVEDVILLKALFCALAQPDAIRDAAKLNSISDATVDNGYQLALTECRRQMEENLNAALQQQPQFRENSSSKRNQRTVYGSPWNFK